MPTPAQQLLADFTQHKWKTPRLYERLFELIETPAELFNFLLDFLRAHDKSTTIFNDGLSYITEAQFNTLITTALEILETRNNENAADVILYASLQFPELLHHRLADIFRLRVNERAYYVAWPWRNLDAQGIAACQAQLFASADEEERERLVRCLFETRDAAAIEFTFNYAIQNDIFPPRRWPKQWLRPSIEAYYEACIAGVGYVRQRGIIRSYCPNPVMHLSFPDNYFPRQQIPASWHDWNRKQHPTWRLPASGLSCRFGGVLDDNAANPFFHIITFEPVPLTLKVTQLQKLVLGCHVTETSCSIPFYHHDADGWPARLRPVEDASSLENRPDAPIRETRVELSLTPPRWQFQSWGSSKSRENLFRIGGEPLWIQNADVPDCPCCGRKMDFLMQLDSGLPDVRTDGELLFGSGGGCYIFWCDGCRVSGYGMQCT
jgi:hypothetical protein